MYFEFLSEWRSPTNSATRENYQFGGVGVGGGGLECAR